jgi:hypothetical protein
MAPSSTSTCGNERFESKDMGKIKSSHLTMDINADRPPHIDIIDIRHDAVEVNLKEEIMASLRPQNGPKTMPTLLLYDERGLQLFEEVPGQDITLLSDLP